MLVNSSTVLCWMSIFVISGVSCLFCLLFYFLWKILSANNVGPDQTRDYMASELDLGLPMTLLRVSRYEWVNAIDNDRLYHIA